MAIHFFSNFVHGGDWILQPILSNSPQIQAMLPENAPLSTFRIVTASSHWRINNVTACQHMSPHQRSTSDELSRYILSFRSSLLVLLQSTARPTLRRLHRSRQSSSESNGDAPSPFKVVTVVFRAGLKGAATDHKAIYFNVDPVTGLLGQGYSNQLWYQMGAQAVLNSCPVQGSSWTHHPESGQRITGVVLHEIPDVIVEVPQHWSRYILVYFNHIDCYILLCQQQYR